MIELKDVTKIYGETVTAVKEVSFRVEEGEVFGLIGTSGCGKTTTLKMINRLIEPTSGVILVDGTDVREQDPERLRRSIGYVIQDVGLFPHYTIEENISIVPKLLEWDEMKVEKRGNELLELVGLDPSEFSNRKPDALSGGQQQRVGLARALAADPPVVLMDEPFGALDPITKERVQGEFKELLHRIRKTIVLVTHDVAEAFDLCDRVALMDKGIVQQIGKPKELLLSPANDFVASFFESNRLELEMQTITVGDMLKKLRMESAEERLASPFEEPVRPPAEDKEREYGNVSPPSKGERHGVSRDKGDDTYDEIKTSTPFAEAYEMFGASDREQLPVEDDKGNIVAELTAEQLLTGFHRLRKSKGGGHG